MCYILKLFYLCASSTKSNKRTEESNKSNLDAANISNSLATKEAAAVVNKKLDVQNNQQNIVIKTELSEFICTNENENEEDRLSAKLEFNENEIYEIEQANKSLLAKKSKKKGSSSLLLSQQQQQKKKKKEEKKPSNNTVVSSSSASCSSSSVVEVEKKQAGVATAAAGAAVVVTSNQLPTEDSSSYSLYEYVRDPKVGKQLRKKTNTLEEFPGEENYFTHPNENEAILLKNKSSYLDFLQLGSTGYNRSNAFDYSSLDRFSMTEMDPQGQQAAFRQANNDKANSSATTTDKQDAAASQNNTDTNSLNSDASSSSMSNDPRQFLSNNQKLPLNANESLFDHLQKSFNSLNLSEDQRKFINPAPSNEPADASRSAAKSKLELFQNKAKFNVSIDNSNLYNNQSVRLAHELAIDPNEPNRMSTSTELINNTASFLSRA